MAYGFGLFAPPAQAKAASRTRYRGSPTARPKDSRTGNGRPPTSAALPGNQHSGALNGIATAKQSHALRPPGINGRTYPSTEPRRTNPESYLLDPTRTVTLR